MSAQRKQLLLLMPEVLSLRAHNTTPARRCCRSNVPRPPQSLPSSGDSWSRGVPAQHAMQLGLSVLRAGCVATRSLLGAAASAAASCAGGRAGCAAGGASCAASCGAVLHTSAQAASPQYGGYLRTGTGTGAEAQHETPRFFVTGACGQIGQEMLPFLRDKVGVDAVIASDVRSSRRLLDAGPFSYCDVLDKDNMARIILENGITHVLHLATLLSAIGERNPALALKVNTQGIQNVLELAAAHGLAVYAPSTIAVFGASTPRHNTPDDTVMRPATMYGITKVHQELLGSYYAERYGVDYRSLRYPGVISANSPPGGGTTDYAVEVFTAALRDGAYHCYLASDAALPMMYIDDCLDATWQLINAPRERLQQQTYNVTAMTFTPAELAGAIRTRLPHFTIEYTPDFRDSIARTWPASIDDSAARQQWGWRHRYDLQALVDAMLLQVAAKLGVPPPPGLQQPSSSSSSSSSSAGGPQLSAPV